MSTKIALITGGSRGLGKNAALKLAKKHNDVILTWHSQQQEAEAVVAEIEQLGGRAAALRLDVSDSSSFSTFAAEVKNLLNEKWQRQQIDYLLNNAGVGMHKLFIDTSAADLDNLYQVHVKGPFLLTQALLPLLADGGHILNVSSGLTRIILPGCSAYAMMKSAMETLTRYQAKELGERRIRVNILAPGAIETDFNGGGVRDNPELNRWVASQTALGRAGQPDDIGDAIALLLSDEAGWINAQRIEASGGQSI